MLYYKMTLMNLRIISSSTTKAFCFIKKNTMSIGKNNPNLEGYNCFGDWESPFWWKKTKFSFLNAKSTLITAAITF